MQGRARAAKRGTKKRTALLLIVGSLVLAGLAADSCIMFTAHDAYLRKYALWIPADCVASEKTMRGDATRSPTWRAC